MWVLIHKQTGRLHLIGRGTFDPSIHNMLLLDYIEVPDQGVSHLYKGDPPVLDGTIDDLQQYSLDEKVQLVDRETAKAIDRELHEFAGVEEQIGILRYAITDLYNRLGEALPDELIAFNDIANDAIHEGQKKKEALQ